MSVLSDKYFFAYWLFDMRFFNLSSFAGEATSTFPELNPDLVRFLEEGERKVGKREASNNKSTPIEIIEEQGV